MNARIVFMGSPDFALPTLRLLAAQYPLAGVVTQPDQPAGRGRALTPPPVKLLAQELGLPMIQPMRLREPEAMTMLQAWQPDLIVVAAFGQILRPPVLDLPRYGCLNVHASLLPRWRGAAPIQAAILYGDLETGVTIMRMDPGVDTGGVLSQRAIAISPDDTARTLSTRLAELGAQLLLDTLPGYLNGVIQPEPQAGAEPSYAPMLKKEDGLLDFTQPVEAQARRVRAFNPWPGTFIMWEGQILKVHRAHAVYTSASSTTSVQRTVPLTPAPVRAGSEHAPTPAQEWTPPSPAPFPHLGDESGTLFAPEPTPGARLVYQGLPALTATGGLLVLDEVQPAGKKAMPGKAFLQGAKHWASVS